ncbi:hypothetical protein [Jiulongibacter sp. NS-SX5]|uniref:hypothetical protein n=1 Tax=Jiulongibacter sp. NS-SX5 TaxID=3463854 RepID=UPI004058E8E1
MKILPFVLLAFLLASCSLNKIKPGSVTTISGTYVSEPINIQTDFNSYSLKLVLSFDENSENGDFNARLETLDSGLRAVEDITGEFENISDTPETNLLIKNVPLLSLNTQSVFILNAQGKLNKNEGRLETLTILSDSESDFTHRGTLNFTPLAED